MPYRYQVDRFLLICAAFKVLMLQIYKQRTWTGTCQNKARLMAELCRRILSLSAHFLSTAKYFINDVTLLIRVLLLALNEDGKRALRKLYRAFSHASIPRRSNIVRFQ